MHTKRLKKPIRRCVQNTLNRILWVDLPFMNFMENRIMRIITLTLIAFLAFTITSTAQTVCNDGCMLQWGAPGDPTDVNEYGLFVYSTPGAYTPAMDPVATVPVGTHSWVIAVPEGEYYAVATSIDLAGNRSIASNEVHFVFDTTPPDPPVNLRITVIVSPEGGATVKIEREEIK